MLWYYNKKNSKKNYFNKILIKKYSPLYYQIKIKFHWWTTNTNENIYFTPFKVMIRTETHNSAHHKMPFQKPVRSYFFLSDKQKQIVPWVGR